MGRNQIPIPATIARDCLAARLRMLNRVVSRIYDDALRPFDVRISQMNILVAASVLGIARPAELAETLHLESSTVSRNVERMRLRGWLERVPDEDARAQPIRLSPAGEQLLKRAGPAWQRAQGEARRILGDDGVELLSRVTDQLRRATSAMPVRIVEERQRCRCTRPAVTR